MYLCFDEFIYSCVCVTVASKIDISHVIHTPSRSLSLTDSVAMNQDFCVIHTVFYALTFSKYIDGYDRCHILDITTVVQVKFMHMICFLGRATIVKPQQPVCMFIFVLCNHN